MSRAGRHWRSSLHVGAPVLALTFDLRYGDRLRGLVYVPLVLLIALATLVLRYHYVVDLVAGPPRGQGRSRPPGGGTADRRAGEASA